MFCHKCGAKAVDGDRFCQKCGAKLIVEGAAAAISTQQVPPKHEQVPPKYYNVTSGQPTKKKSKSGVIPGIVTVLVIIFLALAVINGEDNSDSGDTSTKLASGSNTTQATPVPENVAARDDALPNTDDLSRANKLLYKGIPFDLLLGASRDDIISILGEPDRSMYDGEELDYGDAQLFFDSWTLPEPYLFSISDSLGNFTYNGHTLTDNSQEIIEIMGKEPDEARVFYDTYVMTYSWDHMDSTASFTITLPAAEGSSVTASASLDWWYPDWDAGDDYYAPDNGLPTLPDGFEWVEAPSVTVDYYDISTLQGWTKITGVVKNTSGKNKSYVQIMFNLYDYNGYQVGSAFDNINNLGAGSSWKFEALVLGDVAKYEFAELSGWYTICS